jgi:NitT/TauT family transport system ATP-binding protein
MAPAAAGALELRGVARRFAGGAEVFSGLDLQVPAGQFAALLGPSGCGKSTLLRLIAGLDQADGGTLRVASAGGGDASAGIGFVFQDPHLLPWRTLRRNVELPLELRGVAAGQRREAAMHWLSLVGLAEAAERYPAQLSGGMRMRGSLARALVVQPRILLLDEPFAAVDEVTRYRLDAQLHALWQAERFTALFVTHSVQEAVFLAERVLVLGGRPAAIRSDRSISLAEPRDGALRATGEFAAAVRALQEDLLAAEVGA